MLSDLFQYASEVVGFKPDNAEKRAQLLRWINRAGQELYDSWDLPGSLKEQTFSLGDAASDTNVWLLTLPWYVDVLRGARFPQGMDRITTLDIRPRFHNRPWKQPLLTWRIVGETPLMRELSRDMQLLIMRGAETIPFSVTIRGATGESAMTSESVGFIFSGGAELSAIGQTSDDSYITDNQWVHDNPFCITEISKSAVTQSDVTVYDQDDNVVAIIPNRLTRAKNTLIQLHDDSKGLFEGSAEILFKTPYIPFYYDTDQFFQPKLEDAIIWKLRMLWYSTKEGKTEDAILADQKCKDLVQKICGNIEEAAERTLRYDTDPFEFAALKSYPYRYGRRA